MGPGDAAGTREQGGGTITHSASIEGTQPAWQHAHHCSSKAAIIMHARVAALADGTMGIRVSSVSPGLLDGDGLSENWPGGVDRWQRAAPLGRLGRAAGIGNGCASRVVRSLTGSVGTAWWWTGVSARPAW